MYSFNQRRIVMKPVNMIAAIAALLALSLTNVQAGDRQVGGLIMGSGTGAIVGQAIGRNTESTIVGATLGGVVGLLVGSQLERHHGVVPRHSQIIVRSHSYDNHRYDNRRYDNHRYDRRTRPVFKDHHRKHYRYDKGNCRKVITIQKGHYGSKRVVSTVCGKSPRHYQPERHPFKSRDRFNR